MFERWQVLRASLMMALSLSAACTDVPLQANASALFEQNNRLSLVGQVCTEKPSADGFPVKVLFLIDKSGSMCVSDGPGSQPGGGLCDSVGQRLRARGITEPGRVRALRDLRNQFSGQTNISIAVDLFASGITTVYPASGGELFGPASNLTDTQIQSLQANLDKGTDYQGALAQAYWRIESDIQNTIEHKGKSLLPRTKYVVILLTDGTPYPRCTANDNEPSSYYASAEHPEGVWPDNPGGINPETGQPRFCNAMDAEDTIAEFVGGTDRNQNYQVFDAADRLMLLKSKYNLGDLRLHTILLFNTEGVADAVALGGSQVLIDLYNGMGSPEEAHEVARWTLTEMATRHGNGLYNEFTDRASIELGALDYTSLKSRFVSKSLIARNHFAFPTIDGPIIDSDGDGLPDTQDSTKVIGTQTFITDSDGDCFPDSFEVARSDSDAFDPLKKDPRGCSKWSDTDGDGIPNTMETYLGTDPTLVDSDHDGVPDGMELVYGLEPFRTNDLLMDRDLDGIPDILEIFQHTSPLIDDRQLRSRDAYQYKVIAKSSQGEDDPTCYEFRISNLRLLTPQRANGQVGFNYITLTFGESPEGGVSRDYGTWKQACVFAQYIPPSLRNPLAEEINISDADFVPFSCINTSSSSCPKTMVMRQGQAFPVNYKDVCLGATP